MRQSGMQTVSSPARPQRNTYDTRLRLAYAHNPDPDRFPDVDIPASTLRSWKHRGLPRIVSSDFLQKTNLELQRENAELRSALRATVALLQLFATLLHISGFRLDQHGRLPSAQDKKLLLGAVQHAAEHSTVRRVLELVHMSRSRFYSWLRRSDSGSCTLDDLSSCPLTSPTRLTAREISVMHELFLSPKYLHMPVKALCIFARRTGQLFASPGTWYRVINERGWGRPRVRLYPERPKLGVRASLPNEYWHVDTCVITLLNGTRVYLQAVIDNLSRMILAWAVEPTRDALNTCALLVEAAKSARNGVIPTLVTLVSDDGSENVNHAVFHLLSAGNLFPNKVVHEIAQVTVSYSNSMIEAFFRSALHNYLYLYHLDCIATVRRLVSFYVEQHNFVMPHNSLNGRTPFEVYHNLNPDLPRQLRLAQKRALKKRIAYNRSLTCDSCDYKSPS